MGGQLVELSPAEGHVQVLRAAGVGGDIGQVDGGGGDAGQLDLCFLGGLLQPLHSHLIAAQVDALRLLELGHQVFHDALVKVVAAQTVVARGSQNLNDAVADLQHGHVEGAAAQVVDHNFLVALLVQTVGQGRGGRLVDNALDLQTGNLTGVLGGLTLGVGEVGGDGDDRLGDGGAQIGFRVGFQLLQDHGADLLGGVVLAVHAHPVVAAHLPLDGCNGAVRVGDRLPLGDLTHHALAGLGEGHDGRGGAVALGVGDDDGLAALHHCYAGIGGTQINTDHFRHILVLLYIENKFLTQFIYILNLPPARRQTGSLFPPEGSPSGTPGTQYPRRNFRRPRASRRCA